MSNVTIQDNIEAQQNAVVKLYTQPVMKQGDVDVRNPSEVHYIYNASHMDMSFAREGWEHIGQEIDPSTGQPYKNSPSGICRRGQILPIFRVPKWVADMHPTGTPGAIRMTRTQLPGQEQANAQMLQQREPGYIARAIDSDYSNLGMIVLWKQYSDGILAKMQAVCNRLNFAEKVAVGGLYINSKKLQWTNPKILEFLRKQIREVETGLSDFPYEDLLVSVCEQLISGLEKIHDIHQDALIQAKSHIQNGIIHALDLRYQAICCVGGFNMSDYETKPDTTSSNDLAVAVMSGMNKLTEMWQNMPAQGGTGAGIDAGVLLKLIESQQQMMATMVANDRKRDEEMMKIQAQMLELAEELKEAKAGKEQGSLAKLMGANPEEDDTPVEEVDAPPPDVSSLNSSVAITPQPRARDSKGRLLPSK